VGGGTESGRRRHRVGVQAAPSQGRPAARRCTSGDGQRQAEAVYGEESVAAAKFFKSYSILCARREREINRRYNFFNSSVILVHSSVNR
jgi:hypothetical protein